MRTQIVLGLMMCLFIITIILLGVGSSVIKENPNNSQVLIIGIFMVVLMMSSFGAMMYRPNLVCSMPSMVPVMY
jgi:hypothetical protein